MRAVIGLVLCLMILSACNTPTTKTSGNTFVGGTKALEIDFVADAPPDEPFDGGQQPFDVTVQLHNIGEYDIPKSSMSVKLSGLSPADFAIPNQNLIQVPEDDLQKTTKDPQGNKIEGSIATVTFPNLNYIAVLSGPTSFPVRADVCYKYGSIAETKMCIKENPLNTRDDAVCKVNQPKDVENSASPIHITTVSESSKAKDKVLFTFMIEHVGSGNIYKKDTNCNAGGISLSDENKIWINVNSNMPGLACSGLSGGSTTQGYVTLFKSSDQKSDKASRAITCTQTIPGQSTSFEQLVRINLEYDYKEFISKEITVRHG